MNQNCGIMDDLLPLYLDDACTEESKVAIEKHLQSCNSCREKLSRMRDNKLIPAEGKVECEVRIASYAKKVKKHRIKVAILTVFASFMAAFLLALCILTVRDMHIQSNSIIVQTEDGVHNLTANSLEVTAAEATRYVLFTNNCQVKVTVQQTADFKGEVCLWIVSEMSPPLAAQYGIVTSENNTCVFSGLTAVDRYMVTYDGSRDAVLTISDGHRVSFLGSLKNVLNELWVMILE